MDIHGVKRLKERFHMPVEKFQKEFYLAVKFKHFFKKDFQDQTYSGSINICVPIENKLVVVSLNKHTGKINTIMRPQRADWLKAKKLGWEIRYPQWVEEEF